ncbi:MAG: methyltransferase domain-containing protein [Actinomycetia bacterium]|nr:methyltransferase domain-containing protein [Actinomycetes bacterium]MCP3909968.1 methyltransferase domain-containing protein [Actinomycetes bacterium]MCP4085545.1 methyltransferase domain-containing protein [Actinomycetes bacterium]
MSQPENERYTHGHHSSVVAAHARRTAEEAAAFLLPFLAPDSRLLDVGCGPGSITVGLARRCGEVIGVDSSDDVLESARSHQADQGVENLSFEAGSCYELRWEDETFDVVYAHQLLQHLADPVAALREFRRVLKPGGLVAVRDADYGTMVHAPIDPRIERWRDLFHEVARANGGEPDAGRLLLPWVHQAGFADPVTTATAWVYADQEGRDHWGELWAVRITEGAFAAHAQEFGLATAPEIADLAAAFRDWAARPDGFFGFIHGEVLARRP